MTARRGRRYAAAGLAVAALLVVLLGLRFCGEADDTAQREVDAPLAGRTDVAVAGPDEGNGGAGRAIDPSEPVVLQTEAASGVPIRIVRRPRLDLPAEPYARQFEALLPRAEAGEAVAQYQLGLLLYRCRDVPADDAELARRVDRLYQTRRSEGWDVDDPSMTERIWRESFAQCQGVPEEQRVRYRDWMVRAADQNLLEARLDLMFHLPQGDYCQFIEDCTPAQRERMAQLRERARLDVMAALDAGSVEALRIVGGWALNDEMGVPDPVEALASLSAYEQIQRARGREPEVAALLASLRARLRPVDLDAAETRARELLANPDCCQETR